MGDEEVNLEKEIKNLKLHVKDLRSHLHFVYSLAAGIGTVFAASKALDYMKTGEYPSAILSAGLAFLGGVYAVHHFYISGKIETESHDEQGRDLETQIEEISKKEK